MDPRSGSVQQQQQQSAQQQQQQQSEVWSVTHDAARQRFFVALPLAAPPTTGLSGVAASLGLGSKPALQASEAYLQYRTLGSASCVGAALSQATCQQVELSDIFVPEAFRERGVANSLVLALLGFASDKGICDVRMPNQDVRRYLESCMPCWANKGFEPMLSSRKAAGEASHTALPAQAAQSQAQAAQAAQAKA